MFACVVCDATGAPDANACKTHPPDVARMLSFTYTPLIVHERVYTKSMYCLTRDSEVNT